MLIRRPALRALLAGLAVLAVGSGLAGCRTSPTVAAYVGGDTISVDSLDAAVAAREDSSATLAAYAGQHRDTYPRTVLGLLVTERLYQAIADRYGISVGDQAVRDRITALLQGSDPNQAFDQLAQQGLSRTDVFENVRQQLIRQAVARRSGPTDPLSDASLQAAFEKQKSQYTAKSYGYIDLPDQATAAAVLAQLTAAPASYPAIAAQHPGQLTLPTVSAHLATDTPAVLQPGIDAAAPNTGFTVQGPSGDVVVCFVGGPVTFQDARPALEQAAVSAADAAVKQQVADVRKTLHVTVNPRYGTLKSDGTLTGTTGGVVDILGSSPAPASASGGS